MNKKGIERQTIIELIIAIIVIVILFFIITVYKDIGESTANKQAIQTWVRTNSLKQEVTAGLADTSRPPIPYLQDPLEFELSDLQYSQCAPPESYKEIADSMHNCWGAFDRGKSDFIQSTAKEVFCYPCGIIKFSDEVKQNKFKITGLNDFLNTNKPIIGKNNPTYMQYLANDDNFYLDEEALRNDIITVDKDMYIIFFAASGRAWADIVFSILTADTEVQIDDGIRAPVQTIEKDTDYVETGAALGIVGASALARRSLPSPNEAADALSNALSKETGITVANGNELLNLGTADDILKEIPLKETEIKNLEKALNLDPYSSAAAKQTQAERAILRSKLTEATARLENLKKAEVYAQNIKAGKAVGKATLQIGEKGSAKIALEFAEEGTEKAGKKGVTKLLGKGLSKFGAHLVPGIGWALTVTELAASGYAAYQIFLGDDPFVATVMIADAEKVLTLCNEEDIAEQKAEQEKAKNEALTKVVEGAGKVDNN